MRIKTLSLYWIVLVFLFAGCGTPASAPITAPAPTQAPAAVQSTAMPAQPTTALTLAAAASTVLPTKAAQPTQATAASGDLTVFAAASLTEAFTEIGKQFEASHPGSKVVFNFAGSQQLAQQLAQGAPADIFASANKTQMDAAIKAGRVVSGTKRTFARNRLVVIYPKDNPAGLKEPQDLAQPQLKLVLAAKEVPVGQYTLDFLDKAVKDPAFGPSFKNGVIKNVVSYEQDVKAVLAKVALGEADAGIVYTTDITPGSATKVGRLDIPDALNMIAAYPIAAVSDSKHTTLAKDFLDMILNPPGQQILVKYGFIPVTGND
ncbi:MAG: molybdate ABC transporter substrate-binding protein [Chloroflexi bacterium]|nr:molybdate ABC transporter substrate-binding protein [Chloroflexota bacterium]